MSKIETALEKVNNPDNDDWNHIAGASLTKARQLVAESPQNGMTSEQAAVLALGCIAHAIGTTPFVGLNEAQLEKADPRGCQKKLSEAGRAARDLAVWRVQSKLGPGGLRRRDAFIRELRAAATGARGTASTAADQSIQGAMPFLQQATSEDPFISQPFFSQALHAHRWQVAKKFPRTFLSNCQRTHGRRGRRGRARQPQVQPEAVTPYAAAWDRNTDASAEDSSSWDLVSAESLQSASDISSFEGFGGLGPGMMLPVDLQHWAGVACVPPPAWLHWLQEL